VASARGHIVDDDRTCHRGTQDLAHRRIAAQLGWIGAESSDRREALRGRWFAVRRAVADGQERWKIAGRCTDVRGMRTHGRDSMAQTRRVRCAGFPHGQCPLGGSIPQATEPQTNKSKAQAHGRYAGASQTHRTESPRARKLLTADDRSVCTPRTYEPESTTTSTHVWHGRARYVTFRFIAYGDQSDQVDWLGVKAARWGVASPGVRGDFATAAGSTNRRWCRGRGALSTVISRSSSRCTHRRAR